VDPSDDIHPLGTGVGARAGADTAVGIENRVKRWWNHETAPLYRVVSRERAGLPRPLDPNADDRGHGNEEEASQSEEYDLNIHTRYRALQSELCLLQRWLYKFPAAGRGSNPVEGGVEPPYLLCLSDSCQRRYAWAYSGAWALMSSAPSARARRSRA
jgi:hypothetical protein